MSRRALISTNHFDTWAGSELMTVELAEGLEARGWDVTLHAQFWRENFAPDAIGARFNWVTDQSDLPRASTFDLVYSQHGALIPFWAKQSGEDLFGEGRPAIVFAHLSPTSPLERPSSGAEPLLADLILANSSETLASFAALGAAFEAAVVMPNPAPAQFDAARRVRKAGPAKRVLIVSNHMPKELGQAAAELKEAGLRVRRIGLGNTSRRLLPEDLKWADVVVTIGKTVQFAMRAGCPVFCYDRFGGPGWLTAQNAMDAEAANFSGRCCGTALDGAALAQAVRSVPQDAVDWAAHMADNVPVRFTWEHWLDRLEGLCPAPAVTMPAGDWQLALTLEAQARKDHDHFFAQMRDAKERLQTAVKRNRALRDTINKQKEAAT